MPRAYSQDLRDRIIDALSQEGMSCRGAARRFGVSVASAIKWLQRYRRAGDRRCIGTGGHRRSKVKPQRAWLLAALAARLQAERGVKADTSMLSRFFRGEGISFKKRRFMRASRTGRM